MSAHDFYNGRVVRAPERKSWWNPFSWWPGSDEDPEPQPSPDMSVNIDGTWYAADEEFWRGPVVREILGEIDDINRQIEEASGPENASLRRDLIRERRRQVVRIENLLMFRMKDRSRDGRSAA
jgi:hypothetical protein